LSKIIITHYYLKRLIYFSLWWPLLADFLQVVHYIDSDRFNFSLPNKSDMAKIWISNRRTTDILVALCDLIVEHRFSINKSSICSIEQSLGSILIITQHLSDFVNEKFLINFYLKWLFGVYLWFLLCLEPSLCFWGIKTMPCFHKMSLRRDGWEKLFSRKLL